MTSWYPGDSKVNCTELPWEINSSPPVTVDQTCEVISNPMSSTISTNVGFPTATRCFHFKNPWPIFAPVRLSKGLLHFISGVLDTAPSDSYRVVSCPEETSKPKLPRTASGAKQSNTVLALKRLLHGFVCLCSSPNSSSRNEVSSAGADISWVPHSSFSLHQSHALKMNKSQRDRDKQDD